MPINVLGTPCANFTCLWHTFFLSVVGAYIRCIFPPHLVPVIHRDSSILCSRRRIWKRICSLTDTDSRISVDECRFACSKANHKPFGSWKPTHVPFLRRCIVSSGFLSLHVLSLSEPRLDAHCFIFTELVAHVRDIIILLQGDINDL